jgi:tripartite-type tricarboxylate transporter receptor subunit TctC
MKVPPFWVRGGTISIIAAICAVAMSSAMAQAQFPAKPVRIISGFAPGGFNNSTARLLAQKLSEMYGQQFIVDNRPGANGMIAGDMTAKSLPDGYTLFMSNAGLTTNPLLYERTGQKDSLSDFSPVSLVASIPNVLVIHPSVPAHSLKELLAIAKARKNPLNLASSGVGAPGHLTAEFLQQATGTQFTHVPFKGTGPALIQLIGGQVDLSFPTLATVVTLIESGKLRALGITSEKRSALLPNVPTIGEAAVPGYESVGWHGLVGPAGMPKDLQERLSRDIAKVVRMPDVLEVFRREGAEAVGNSPEQFSVYLADDLRKWTQVIKKANIGPSKW